MLRNRNQRGATLIEVVVVAFIVVVALAALANLTVISLGRNRQSKELAVSTRLAQEGLEWFKAQRTALGYQQFSNNATVIAGDNQCLSDEVSGWDGFSLSVQSPETNSSCIVNTNYHRWYSIAVEANYVEVTVKVTAPGDSDSEAITLVGKIYEWQR